MPVHVTRNTSPGAPALSGEVGKLLGILDAALIIGQVFSYNGASFTDNSAEARLDGGTAFALFPTPGTSDICYFGSPGETIDAAGAYKPAFKQLIFDLSVLGVGGTYVWEYWNGTAWTTLTVTDGTNGFTQDGTVSWTIPTDWATTAVNAVTTYWVRVRCTATPTTNPTCSSVSALGWLRGFQGTNKAAYKQGAKSGRLQMFFRVQDDGPGAAGAREVRLRGYEGMTDVDTGAGEFPTVAQRTNGNFARKSATLDATARGYVVAADGRTFHVSVLTGDIIGGYFTFSFGDGYSYVPGDQYCVLTLGRADENSAAASGDSIATITPSLTSVASTHYVPRPYTGVGTSLQVGKHIDSAKGGATSTFGAGGLLYTNPSDGKLWASPIWIHEIAQPTVRGYMRGLWAPLHARTYFNDRDWADGTGPLAGKRLLLIRDLYSSTGAGGCGLIETSDTWDTD
jgi:hypothetical protein